MMTGSRRVSRAQVCFFLISFFVTNFLFVLGMNRTTTGMPDNGGTCQWHWQGREGRCDERSLVMEHWVIGFSINISVPYPCRIVGTNSIFFLLQFQFELSLSIHIFWHF